MSKNNLIAVAIAAALASPAAFATTVTVGAAPSSPVIVASNPFVDATVTVANIGKAVNITADANDAYLGRTTGYNIRIELPAGAKFAAAMPASALLVGATDAATLAGGGAVDGTSATYAVTPDAALGVVAGDGIGFAAGAISLKGVASLGTPGTTIAITIKVQDPVTGSVLTTASGNLIRSAEGWAVSYTAGANTQFVDVGADSKKMWIGGASVGSGAAATLFHAGSVAAGLATTPAGINTLSLDASVAEAEITVSGTDFSAFKTSGTNVGRVYLAADATCGYTAGTNPVGTVSTDGKSVSFVELVDDVQTYPALCFDGNGVTAIKAQEISVSTVITQVNHIDSKSFAGELRGLVYNGPVVNVYHFNPASNADQVSYLRISNTSGSTGNVVIEGVCDNGVASATPLSFALAAGNSVLLTSKDVEEGNATKGLSNGLGACAAGKYRLTVTGEFATMQVQNFLRNATSAGMINTNVNNQN